MTLYVATCVASLGHPQPPPWSNSALWVSTGTHWCPRGQGATTTERQPVLCCCTPVALVVSCTSQVCANTHPRPHPRCGCKEKVGWRTRTCNSHCCSDVFVMDLQRSAGIQHQRLDIWCLDNTLLLTRDAPSFVIVLTRLNSLMRSCSSNSTSRTPLRNELVSNLNLQANWARSSEGNAASQATEHAFTPEGPLKNRYSNLHSKIRVIGDWVTVLLRHNSCPDPKHIVRASEPAPRFANTVLSAASTWLSQARNFVSGGSRLFVVSVLG